ncbi:MAG TPA: hypothetical protein VE843_04945 [Ktedonobacteraceae bacterium]|nr:hypothetical protein [Ktedonobacteraceae bacterium]
MNEQQTQKRKRQRTMQPCWNLALPLMAFLHFACGLIAFRAAGLFG